MLISLSHPKIHTHVNVYMHAHKLSSWDRKLRIKMSLEFVHILATVAISAITPVFGSLSRSEFSDGH